MNDIETLMIAPEGSTHHYHCSVIEDLFIKINSKTTEIWDAEEQLWELSDFSDLYWCEDFRSLADIERIVDLEEEVKEIKTSKAMLNLSRHEVIVNKQKTIDSLLKELTRCKNLLGKKDDEDNI